ncbi:MAG: succinate dehydrogenase assembly factor 2 [Agarilytica sp.]
MDINRLRWACRRGMLELDLVLLPFLENTFSSLSEDDQLLFEQLLEGEDQDMFGWFLRRVEPEDPDTRRIVNIIRESVANPNS